MIKPKLLKSLKTRNHIQFDLYKLQNNIFKKSYHLNNDYDIFSWKIITRLKKTTNLTIMKNSIITAVMIVCNDEGVVSYENRRFDDSSRFNYVWRDVWCLIMYFQIIRDVMTIVLWQLPKNYLYLLLFYYNFFFDLLLWKYTRWKIINYSNDVWYLFFSIFFSDIFKKNSQITFMAVMKIDQ